MQIKKKSDTLTIASLRLAGKLVIFYLHICKLRNQDTRATILDSEVTH